MADADLEKRFWRDVDKSGDCWLWLGTRDKDGYGKLQFKGVKYLATRLSWQIANDAAWPEGRLACHHCDTPSCVNPAHLYAGTHSDNLRDCIERGRWVQPPRDYERAARFTTLVCKSGHRRTAQTVAYDRRGKIVCKPCVREAGRRFQARKRSAAA